MTNNKLRIHIKNNHASSGTFPPTIESEEVFTITEERFRDACERFPADAEQVEAFIDWDLEHFRFIRTRLSFPRRRESSHRLRLFWIPGLSSALAGMTGSSL